MGSISSQASQAFGDSCHLVNSNMKAEDFVCPICIDLVYKPIVNACGHIFCFWCVQKAMNPFSVSYCPLCRMVFAHFPRICALLHIFLKQAFPKEYHIRASEVKEEECKNMMFSPSLEEPLEASDIEENGKMSNTVTALPEKTREGVTLKKDLSNSVNSLNSSNSKPTTSTVYESREPIFEKFKGPDNGHHMAKLMEENRSDTQGANSNTGHKLNYHNFSLELFSCPSCEDLLQLPVVLNCGHAICSGCINGALGSHNISSLYFCPSCKQQQPRGRLEVCLQLHEIIETLFPEKVVERRERRREASGKAAVSNDDVSSLQVSGSIEEDGKIPKRKNQKVESLVGGKRGGKTQMENTSENLSERSEEGGLTGSSFDGGSVEGYNGRTDWYGRKSDSRTKEPSTENDITKHSCKGDGEISLMQKSLAKVMAVQQKLDESESEEEKQVLREVLEKTKREQFIHIGVGCDGCGAYPIVGPRHRCRVCPEAIGFDLCGVCCQRGTVLGRFNQRHRSSHEMEEVPIDGQMVQLYGFLGSLSGMHPRTVLALLQDEDVFEEEEEEEEEEE